MKAITFEQYGSPDVLVYKDIASPQPKEDEVLIKVHAASVNAADWHLLRADPFPVRFMVGLFKPKFNILGCDAAGVVEVVGGKVTRFKAGDRVFADLSVTGWGAFAEYACAKERLTAAIPDGVSFEQAASIPVAGVTALQALRDNGKVRPGMTVLINGASGGVGTFAVQLAKEFGAEVTAVCSTKKMELVRSLGADHVIDYTKEDFTTSGKRYDVILAANGYHPLSAYRRALAPNGVYIMTGGTTEQMMDAIAKGPFVAMTGGPIMGKHSANLNHGELTYIAGLVASGKVRPVIDRRYPLAQTADAVRYIEEGHAAGKVVITIAA